MRPQTIVFFDIPYRSRLVTTLAVVRALVERGQLAREGQGRGVWYRLN
ncbi:MAG: hypothetical protein KC457_03305 [Myxococcales bacterium]|nr:hypothetical protein [Myxococcales bacterium]